MPTKSAHLEQARHNISFLETIDKNAFSDWAIVVLFYAALHYVDAYLADQGIHPDRHLSRDSAVAASATLKPIYSEYRKLKTDSFNARYYPPYQKNSQYVVSFRHVCVAPARPDAGQAFIRGEAPETAGCPARRIARPWLGRRASA